MKTKILFIIIGILLQTGNRLYGQESNNTTNKAKILAYIDQIYKSEQRTVISGQTTCHNQSRALEAQYRYIDELVQKTGKYPGMLAVDYGYTPVSDRLAETNAYIIDYWNKGGLVSISFHPGNPVTGGSAWDMNFDGFKEMATEGTPLNIKWKTEVLDKIADGLAMLRDNGVIVLWRPYHEMNGNWFWWCPYNVKTKEWRPADDFKGIWVYMYHYFTKTRKLDNLLWVFSPNVSYGTEDTNTTDYYYPGSEYVDIVALDWYTNTVDDLNSDNSYDRLVALGKPFGISEFGPEKQFRDGSFDNLLIAKALTVDWRAAFFIYWDSWGSGDRYAHVAIMDNKNAKELMTHPKIINRDKISWRSSLAGEYFVAPNGDDRNGDGSPAKPWQSITKAAESVPDNGSTIIVKDGIYMGNISIDRQFEKTCRIVAENPYKAHIIGPGGSGRAMLLNNVSNVVFSGFDIYGEPRPGEDDRVKNPFLIQITTPNANHIRFENCFIHDSYNNDLIKINSSANHIVFSNCAVFNQTTHVGDQLFDINTVRDIIVEDCLLFSDYAGSGRNDPLLSQSFIVIKSSSSNPERICNHVTVRRNVFFNWSGRNDQAFILLGEDARPVLEAQDILIENNLLILNSKAPVWGTLLYKGSMKNVTTRANTVTGHPNSPIGHPNAQGFGYYSVFCFLLDETFPPMEEMVFANNLFSDNTGKMPRFSHVMQKWFKTPKDLVANNNLYWNGGSPIHSEPADIFTPVNDHRAILGNPHLTDVPHEQIIPRINPKTGLFYSGNKTIRQEFYRFVKTYAIPGVGSAAIGEGNPDPRFMPADDILGTPRNPQFPDVGCYETEK